MEIFIVFEAHEFSSVHRTREGAEAQIVRLLKAHNQEAKERNETPFLALEDYYIEGVTLKE